MHCRRAERFRAKPTAFGAPVELASHTTLSVTGSGLFSTTGNFSQSGGDKTLAENGTGVLDMNGTQQACKTLTVTDGTANVNGLFVVGALGMLNLRRRG